MSPPAPTGSQTGFSLLPTAQEALCHVACHPPTVLTAAHLHVTPHRGAMASPARVCLCAWCSPPRTPFPLPAPPAKPDPPPCHLFTAQPRYLCSGMQPLPPPRAPPEQRISWVPGASSLARWGTCVQGGNGGLGRMLDLRVRQSQVQTQARTGRPQAGHPSARPAASPGLTRRQQRDLSSRIVPHPRNKHSRAPVMCQAWP